MRTAEAEKKFADIITFIARSKGISDVFNAFLDFGLWIFSFKQLPEPDSLKSYSEEDKTKLMEAFDVYSYAADNDGEGFYDSLGEFFMEHLSFGKNGQFFTPQNITDMMAIMTSPEPKDGQKICDPACGSGRTLLSIGKMNRSIVAFGSDIDLTCVKMCALNMLVNTMQGEVAWMNTLTMEHWRSYHIKRVLFSGVWLSTYSIGEAGETSFIQKEDARPQETAPKQPQQTISIQSQLNLF